MKKNVTLLMCIILISDFVFIVTMKKSIAAVQWRELYAQFQFGEIILIILLIYLCYRFLFWMASFSLFFIPSLLMFFAAMLKYGDKIISWFEKEKCKHCIRKRELLHFAIAENNIPAYHEYNKKHSSAIDKDNMKADLLFSFLLILEIACCFYDIDVIWCGIAKIATTIDSYFFMFSYLFYGVISLFLVYTAIQPLGLFIEKSLEDYVCFQKQKTVDLITNIKDVEKEHDDWNA